MDPTDLSDAQLDQLADQLAGRLPSGTHGDRVVLSRRAFAAAVGGTLGASGLVALGVDPAAAQAAGQVGTSSDPVDAFVYDLDVANALQSDLDAGGNALTNVGSLSTGDLSTGRGWTSQTRSFDTTYTNNTSSELLFVVTVSSNANGTGINILPQIDGDTKAQIQLTLDNGDRIATPTLTVPSGANYTLKAFGNTADYEVGNWQEFRV